MALPGDLDATYWDRVVTTTTVLPFSPRSAARNTNSPSFHVMKLERPDTSSTRSQVLRLWAEWAIQPFSGTDRQAVWYTAYIFVLPQGGPYTVRSGVFDSWDGIATTTPVSRGGFMNVVLARGISPLAVAKGVVQRMYHIQNGTVVQNVNLRDVFDAGTFHDLSRFDIFSCLVTAGMHDGDYQVHGTLQMHMLNEA